MNRSFSFEWSFCVNNCYLETIHSHNNVRSNVVFFLFCFFFYDQKHKTIKLESVESVTCMNPAYVLLLAWNELRLRVNSKKSDISENKSFGCLLFGPNNLIISVVLFIHGTNVNRCMIHDHKAINFHADFNEYMFFFFYSGRNQFQNISIIYTWT